MVRKLIRHISTLRAENERLASELAHMRSQAGDDSCADYAARNRELTAELVALREKVERQGRLETGPFRPSPDDWTGVFIRGDNARHYAQHIRAGLDYLNILDVPLVRETLTELASLLESSNEAAARKEGKS